MPVLGWYENDVRECEFDFLYCPTCHHYRIFNWVQGMQLWECETDQTKRGVGYDDLYMGKRWPFDHRLTEADKEYARSIAAPYTREPENA